ncbi:hypothetical protein [Syntrophomonas curvata]
MKEDTAARKDKDYFNCGLCQSRYFPLHPGDVLCPECESRVKDSSDWITGVFYLYQDSDFESLMLLIPLIRKQLRMRAEELCHLALEAYRNDNLTQAGSLWQEARRYDPKNIQAAFNLAYIQWKNGEIEYADFISSLCGLENICFDYGEYHEFITRIEYAMSRSDDIEAWLPLADGKSLAGSKALRKQAPELAKTIPAHRGRISAASFSSDSNYLLTAGYDGQLSLWDVNTGRELQRFTFKHAQITAACLTPDGFQVLAATDDYTLHLLDLNTGQTIRQFRGHRALPVWVGVTPYGRMALSGSWDGAIGFWNLQNSRPMNLYRANTGPINSMWMSGDGMCLLLTGLKKEFRMLDLSGEMNHRWLGLPDRWPFSICSTDDKRYVLCGNTDGSINLWNLNSGRCLKTLFGHRGTVNCLTMSSDSGHAISAGIDRTVRIWDLNKGTETSQLNEQGRQVKCLGFAGSNHLFFTAGDDGRVRLWAFS